jgi:hypothetical protein
MLGVLPLLLAVLPSVLPGPFSFFRSPLSALQAQLAAIQVNQTIGHSDAVLAIGLNAPDRRKRLNAAGEEENDVNGDGSREGTSKNYLISSNELSDALQKALVIASQSQAEIVKAGWKLVHKGDIFYLYKRRVKRLNGDGPGPVEYLMTGNLPDISPRTFLHAQLNKNCRKQWDKTMKDMSDGSTIVMEEGGDDSEDILYYRTKWPWPLKDRDYTLARRTKYFADRKAIMLISKSTECADYPREDGVIRVDNYWCHSAILSTRAASAEESPSADDGPSSAGDNNSDRGNSNATPDSSHSSRSPAEQGQFDERKKKLNARARQRRSVAGPRFRMFKPYTFRRGAAADDDAAGGDASPGGLTGGSTDRSGADGNAQADASDENDGKREGKQRGERAIAAVDLPGTSFITLFCDDQKVPLPPTIVDILSKQGEKLVPDSISSLYEVARGVEKERQEKRQELMSLPPATAVAPDAGSGSSVGGSVDGDRETTGVSPTGSIRVPGLTPRRASKSSIEDIISRGLSGSASPPF